MISEMLAMALDFVSMSSEMLAMISNFIAMNSECDARRLLLVGLFWH
jgi:hypothetical protein